MQKPRRKWRFGVNRWFILLFVILGVLAARAYPPILPHIQLPAERLPYELFTIPLVVVAAIFVLLAILRRAWEALLFAAWLVILTVLPMVGLIKWTNTLTAIAIADVILLLISLSVRRAAQSGSLVPKGLSGAVEALLEVVNNLTESTAGRWAREIFPFFATITLLVLIANWTELIPGVDSIGILEESEHGYPTKQVLPGVFTIVKPEASTEGEEHAGGYALVPFVRVASTDLNFTVALALISVVMTQVFGARALGGSYFTKFINLGGLFKRPVFGAIDFAVGLLELVSEISKLLSFSFRLFGNIFAGSVLLFVIGTLVPVFAQSLFLGLEFAVGLIQAVVFGMLTMVFMSQATQGHAGHEEHAEETAPSEATPA